MAWEVLGTVAPADLVDTRLQLHWAAQALGGAGRALAEPRDDDSHTASVWRDGGLESPELPGGSRLRLDLQEAALEIPPSGTRLSLEGRTLPEAFAWVAAEAGRGRRIPLPDYDMPPHPVADGQPFRFGAPQARREIARWYGNLGFLLEDLRAGKAQSSAVRCWPHHFDLAFLTPLGPGEAHPETARSVGIGLSPGDGNIPEPYLYVLPWPRPECTELPGLSSGGAWWTDGFLSAILTGTDLLAGDPAGQEERVRCFLQDAWAASLRLLGS